MVRKQRILMPLSQVLFLIGILVATIVLSIIGFRSISNEEWISKKNYEISQNNLKQNILDAVQTEKHKFVGNVRELALDENYLPDSGQSVLSMFVFKGESLIYPEFKSERIVESEIDKSDAEKLKQFRELCKANKLDAALQIAVNESNNFMKEPDLSRLDWFSFVLPAMFKEYLENEDVSKENRENILKRSNKLNAFLRSLNTYRNNSRFIQAVGFYASYSNEDLFFLQNDETSFAVIPISVLTYKMAVVAEIDSVSFVDNLKRSIENAARDWRSIPYSIINENDSLISGIRIPNENEMRIEMNADFPKLTLVLSTSGKELKGSENKILILYAMVICSLIIPVIGVIVVYRGFLRERQLRLMKDNFLSTISHELKTPLTSVKMYSELICSGRVQNVEKIQSFTGIVLKETDRLQNMIEAILSYTRMDSGKKVFRWENVNFSECVSEICQAVAVIANSKGLELEEDIEDNCFIEGDYPSLLSVAQNLIDNAIKYTPAGKVSVKLQATDKTIQFSVSDTGKGIPANEQKNIFDGFYRIGDESTRETKGSGLGLAIVKRTIEVHKASILVKSSPGKGSIFTVIFKRLENAT